MIIEEKKESQTIFGQEITVSTGYLAKQANGSVTVQCGNTVLLATATMAKQEREGIDFFPLTVEFAEKMYAAGKIPGGFFKREARPSTNATLVSRLIDRPLRPLFPKGFKREVQIVITVLSYDENVQPDALAIVASSAALAVSNIPFAQPVGSVVVGKVGGQLTINPTPDQLKESTINLVVAGTKEAIMMIESESKEVSEEEILEAITFGHQYIKEYVALQEKLVAQVAPVKLPFESPQDNQESVAQVKTLIEGKIKAIFASGQKKEIEDQLAKLEEEIVGQLTNEEADNEQEVKAIFNKIKKEEIRRIIIQDKVRPDGRGMDEIRPIHIKAGVLPATHGSAVFTRGETQSLGVLTLGTALDEQMIDGLDDTKKSKYFFHYNFPPFSVGECGFLRTGRRELGHGALAERALKQVLPKNYPYTIRLVSEILESNGSSSMASVCSGSLALMDGGVPIKDQVAGIAMGLLIENGEYAVLSDIQGLEDHYGDMDFKVAGTKAGITALQLDIKVSGLSEQIMKEALEQAKKGRTHILGKMNEVLDQSRSTMSEFAPRMETIKVNPEKIGMIIGPGGKNIRKIEEESGAQIIIEEDKAGDVTVSAKNNESLQKAVEAIQMTVAEAEVGKVYDGKVVRVVSFGAFIEILPGQDGLLHISKISKRRIDNVEEVLEVGQEVEVKVNQIDNQNRVSLELVKFFD